MRPSFASGINDVRQIVGHSQAPAGVGGLHATFWAVGIEQPPPPGEDPFEDLVNAVAALCVPGGVLNKGQCRSLQAKLDAAEKAMEHEKDKKHKKDKAARKALEAFIHEVEAFDRGGILSSAQAANLIALANAVIATL